MVRFTKVLEGSRRNNTGVTDTVNSGTVNRLGLLMRWQRALKQSPNTVLYRKGRDVSEYELHQFFSMCSDKRVQLTPEYAVFSAISYGSIGERTASVREQIINIPSGWELRRDFPSASELRINDGYRVKGLHYDIWYSQTQRIVVISFRGTQARIGDWIANLRWITRFIPRVEDHYDIVRVGMEQLVDHATDTLGTDVRWVAVGHSLGGGLAQHAAYSHPAVTDVYAFNSSPVTAFSSVAEPSRTQNRQQKFIARVFEHGEFLAYVRFALRKFYRSSIENPEIIEIRFNFEQRSNFLSEHSMSRLARNIWTVARSEPFSASE